MNYLVDTHALAWFFIDRQRLPPRILAIFASSSDEIFFSPVSVYEIGLKYRIGKWPEIGVIAHNVDAESMDAGLMPLAIGVGDARIASSLPLVHRDPFDRLLAAQSIGNGLPILSADPALDLFGVTRVWD